MTDKPENPPACPWGFNWHRFKPRYDMICNGVNANATGEIFASRTGANDVRRVYVADVCVKCGLTIERTKPNE